MLTVCLLGADGVSTPVPVPVPVSVPEEEVAVIAMLVV